MSPARRPLPPSSSLPALRSLGEQPRSRIATALAHLHALYCPLPTSVEFQTKLSWPKDPLIAPVDSGYASDNDEFECEGDNHNCISKGVDEAGFELRDDPFERSFAERWLIGFLSCAEELRCFENEESRQSAIDEASLILASFFSRGKEEGSAEDFEIMRDYHFILNLKPGSKRITIQLTDGLAGMSKSDHTDVGLQSWGAAFVFTELMCASPARLGFTHDGLGPSPRVVELGAGTGLVGIALGKILPEVGVPTPNIIVTDFHPTVLANMQANIYKNFGMPNDNDDTSTSRLVRPAHLDWENPNLLYPPLDKKVDVLVATDAIYEPKHASWLRDCAARMLKPDGVFWLMLTVRTTGKFEGISGTVRASFNKYDGLQSPYGDTKDLAILDEERFARPNGIGRGDESEYRLFRIGWAARAL
jgi:predicted nicotinamide N-methyase